MTKNHFSASYQLPSDHPSAKAVEKMPYPTTPVDHSIFEHESLEYTSAMEELNLSTERIVSSVQVLLQMVGEGRYAAAEKLRAELVDIGVSIPPSNVYEKAARNALRPSFREDPLTTFTNWFSLIPEANVKLRKFRSLRTQLFARDHIPRIDIIMRFGLIAASKGHARHITPEVISVVVRHTEPAVSRQYLADFEKEAMRWTGSAIRGMKGMKRGTLLLKDMHSLAVRTQAIAGRLGDAVALIQAARNRGVNISGFTYGLLMRKLKRAGDEQALRIVRELAPPHVQDTFDVPWTSASTDEVVKFTTLASRLRTIRKAIKPNSCISHPHKSIADFIHDYRETTARETAISLLRKRAFRCGRHSASDWVLAELHYHHSRNEFVQVLLVFRNYFHLLGVPADIVQFCIRTRVHNRKVGKGFSKVERTHGGFMSTTKCNWTPKLWPTPYHTALVWGALLWMNGYSTVDRLYRRLLSQAHQNPAMISAGDAESPGVPASDENIGLEQTPSHVIDGAHFIPFLVAFTKRQQTEQAFQVMSDMVKLGIYPGVEHWTILAGFFARFGDARQALWILDRMEADEDKADTRSDSDTREPKLPAPTLGTYTNIMKSFILAGRWDLALDVKTRMMTRFQYVVGQRPPTDRVLSALKDYVNDSTFVPVASGQSFALLTQAHNAESRTDMINSDA
jgi:pentatricopeptide repeat protein